jgi:maltodextrin utilization protein YvdJ
VWRRSPSFIHKKAAIVVVIIIVVVVVVVVIATIVIVAAALILYIGGKHMQFGIKKKCTSLNTRKK